MDLARNKNQPQPELSKGKRKRETSKSRKQLEADRADALDAWSPFLFRGFLFAFFSGLSLLATRNSHQFAAVVGTVTAWNFGEWFAMIRARRLRLDPSLTGVRLWPRLVTLATLGLVILAVGSGQFYAWAGEGRTIGLGEEPLWFPRAAVEFAGREGMPDKLVAFHNGHASLYEYYYAPRKLVYTDARLEVMGPQTYTDYINLSRKMGEMGGNWAEELDKMGRPAVLVDNLQIGSSAISATLLGSRHYRCVYYDPIACVFIHDQSQGIGNFPAVDFMGRHCRNEANLAAGNSASLAAMARSLRLLGTDCLKRGDRTRSLGLFLLGLDYSRKQREVAPSDLDGWKNAGLIELLRDIIDSREPIPRFRLPFDPVFDLSLAQGTYFLSRALEIDPNEGIVQYYLANSFKLRGMDEQALPLLAAFAAQPNKNLTMQRQKVSAADQAALIRAKLGPPPKTTWSNRAELEPLVAGLLNQGRAATAADVMEDAYRPEARPWEWADRLAVLRLHLGQPARARAVWLAASTDVPAATRLARIAVTYLIEGDFESARKSFREAIAADPRSFEAHFGLATLEQDAGLADEASSEARQAEKLAPNENSKTAARAIAGVMGPYAKQEAGGRP